MNIASVAKTGSASRAVIFLIALERSDRHSPAAPATRRGVHRGT